MSVMTLQLVDPMDLDDDDTWVDFCHSCGTFDNHGDAMCRDCDD